MNLTAAQVDDCRREECYSYVPVDQQFGEPTHWSFSLYDEYEVEANGVVDEDEPEEVISFEELEDEPQMEVLRGEDPLDQMLADLMEKAAEAKIAPNARIPVDPPGTLGLENGGRSKVMNTVAVSMQKVLVSGYSRYRTRQMSHIID